jgi:hypothetical protein
MTYQGERARPVVSEAGRCFEVSKVRLADDGHVSAVLWGEIDPASDREVGVRVVAPVADVVDAIHDGALVTAVFAAAARHLPQRRFSVVEHADGHECITLGDTRLPGRNLVDMLVLEA